MREDHSPYGLSTPSSASDSSKFEELDLGAPVHDDVNEHQHVFAMEALLESLSSSSVRSQHTRSSSPLKYGDDIFGRSSTWFNKTLTPPPLAEAISASNSSGHSSPSSTTPTPADILWRNQGVATPPAPVSIAMPPIITAADLTPAAREKLRAAGMLMESTHVLVDLRQPTYTRPTALPRSSYECRGAEDPTASSACSSAQCSCTRTRSRGGAPTPSMMPCDGYYPHPSHHRSSRSGGPGPSAYANHPYGQDTYFPQTSHHHHHHHAPRYCFKCKDPTHLADRCPMFPRRCFRCGDLRHVLENCPIERALMSALSSQQGASAASTSSSHTSSNPHHGFGMLSSASAHLPFSSSANNISAATSHLPFSSSSSRSHLSSNNHTLSSDIMLSYPLQSSSQSNNNTTQSQSQAHQALTAALMSSSSSSNPFSSSNSTSNNSFPQNPYSSSQSVPPGARLQSSASSSLSPYDLSLPLSAARSHQSKPSAISNLNYQTWSDTMVGGI
mmetsp:Transcript_13145/g.21539  ORF Transcript_13145/g.21539 Transcript_13145/m.21539 type:complete len:501 (+) Transcript_13145:294-1796(+)|eukprot:CAMPEP_0184651012 /NCGR_PEP_ID=MMETSP0308-20130426/8566_1 /TAXON_ID=38269 /ORGANISM="Gloeochaete witrockiana, Strain SAG 46.84" /LENGTH=500 /DNA_ID=CAMNT_0027084913 /DNA_START=273 /DNA_END=1775 /DNA_ORIENTATION=-